jgi:hypothetical protein
METYHILTIIAVAPTDTKPARIKIVSERRNESIIIGIPSDGTDTSFINIAATHLKEKGFAIVAKGEGKGRQYLMTTNFESIK